MAHLYQAILNGEDHVRRIGHLTTLAGYVHWQLTGEKVLGIGDASGMFPIDIAAGSYDARMLAQFDQLAAESGVELRLADLLPTIRLAGEPAGELTDRARSCSTRPGGCVLASRCALRRATPGQAWWPPIRLLRAPGTSAPGRASSPWSCLSASSAEYTASWTWSPPPPGDLVAMVHCNNGASELNAWVGLFAEFAAAVGAEVDSSTIFETLFTSALDGAPDGGGLMAYNYLSGEPITELDEGRPLFLRSPDSAFNLANFMRAQLFASLATLRIGMDVLQKERGRTAGPDVRARRPVQDQGGGAALPGCRHRHSCLSRRGRRRGWRLGDRGAGRLSRWSHVRTEPGRLLEHPGVRRQRSWRPSSPTRPTWPASTHSSSGTSPPCRWNGRPSSTADELDTFRGISVGDQSA